jgi:hypothetical protein
MTGILRFAGQEGLLDSRLVATGKDATVLKKFIK